jgi:hypothetical protein
MFMKPSRTPLVFGLWLVAVMAIAGVSTAVGARASTTAFLAVLSAAPMGIAILLGFSGSRTLTPHELLYAARNPSTRRH